MDFRMLQRVRLIGVIPLMCDGIEQLHIDIGLGGVIAGAGQIGMVNEVLVDSDTINGHAPASVCIIVKPSRPHTFCRSPLPICKVVLQRLQCIKFLFRRKTRPLIVSKLVIQLLSASLHFLVRTRHPVEESKESHRYHRLVSRRVQLPSMRLPLSGSCRST